MMLFLLVGTVYGEFAGGDGTADKPYKVETAAQLNEVRNHLDAYFLQTNNIDLTEFISTEYNTDGWLPIGTNVDNQRFTGSYDGGGHAITGLWINRESTNNVGLFGCIGHGTTGGAVVISNVHLTEVGEIKGASGVGSLVGRVNGDENVLIINCSAIGGVSGKVSGIRVTGGLVGANNSYRETPGGEANPVIRQSYANIAVEGRGTLAIGGAGPTQKEKFGGLVGCNQKGNTIDSYARGSVTIVDGPAQRVGGLAGCTDIRGLVDRCYSTGKVVVFTGSTDVGGLVGARAGQGQNIGQVINSYWDVDASEKTTSPGGGTGKNTTEMKTQSTFVNWDFTNIWAINEGNDYPTLQVIVTNFPQDGNTSWSTTATTTDWNNADNWISGIPISSTDVTIPVTTTNNYPVLSGNVTIASLTISDVASLTIGPNAAMRVSGDITNSAGNEGLLIQSTASGTGSLLHNTDDVPAIIERFIPGSPEGTNFFHLVSVPLTGEPTPQSELFLGSHLYEFDVTNQAWSHMGASLTNDLFVNKGYMIYYPVDAPKTYSFAGAMNNGEIIIPLAYHTTTDYNGFNLVPNPYPSALDWDAVGTSTETNTAWTKTNIANAIYIWNSGWSPSLEGYTGNYASYVNGVGSNGGSNYIPVGQAFFVQATDPNPALTVTNDARVHSDQPFLKRAGAAEQEVLRIKAFANNYRDEFVWRFHEGASTGYDSRYDAAKMYGLAEAPQLYGIATDQQKLSIFSHPHPTKRISIPLGFELGVDDAVTLTFEGIQSFDTQLGIYIEDLQKGKMVDLRNQTSYAFAHEQGGDQQRFVLHFDTEIPTGIDQPGEQEAQVPHQIFAVNKELHIHIPSLDGQEAVVELFDLLGRRQQQERVVLGAKNVIDVSHLEGVAIVRVMSGQKVFTQRVMLK